MPSNTEVPITMVSAQASNYLSTIVIGKQAYYPATVADNSYWFSVYDRNSLQQVFSQVQVGNGDSVPADLAGKFNTAQYFMVVATRSLLSGYVPAGQLYAFLVDNGAGTALKHLTQSLQQLGCGSLNVMNYVMAGVLGPGVPPTKVEASEINPRNPLFLTATLIGVPVNNAVLYTPMPLTLPTP